MLMAARGWRIKNLHRSRERDQLLVILEQFLRPVYLHLHLSACKQMAFFEDLQLVFPLPRDEEH